MRAVSNQKLLSFVVWLAGVTGLLGMLMFAFSQRDAARLRALTRTVDGLQAEVDSLTRGRDTLVAERERAVRALVISLAELRRRLNDEIAVSRRGLQEAAADSEITPGAALDVGREAIERVAAIEEKLRAQINLLLANIDEGGG